MADAPAPSRHSGRCWLLSFLGPLERNGRLRNKYIHTALALLAAAALLTFLGPLLFAQGLPRVMGVDPSSGKVNDTVTVAGENLGKGTVSAVFLSDDKADYKARSAAVTIRHSARPSGRSDSTEHDCSGVAVPPVGG